MKTLNTQENYSKNNQRSNHNDTTKRSNGKPNAIRGKR